MNTINSYANTYSYSSKGFSGLASGLDTESMVKAMLASTQSKIDKQKQQIEQIKNKQSAYRDIITKVNSFNDLYTSFTNPLTNIASQSIWNSVSSSSSNDAVRIVSGSESNQFTINNITSLASAASLTGKSHYSNAITLQFNQDSFVNNQSLTVSLNGVSKDIALSNEGNSNSIDNIISNLNQELSYKFGDNITASYKDGNIVLMPKQTNGSMIKVSSEDENTKLSLNLSQEKTNYINTQKTVNETFNLTEDSYTFSINNAKITVNGTDTIDDMIKKVNESDAGVEMKYDTLSGSFSLTQKSTGSGFVIDISEDKLMNSIFGNTNERTSKDGTNAVLTVNNTKIERTNNTFDINGTTIELTKTTNEATNIINKVDTSSIKKLITDYVNAYNTMYSSINKELKADATFKSYAPLTDAQKDEMSEKEIELWEEKSKEGLLSGDSTIRSLLTDFRRTLYSSKSEDGLSIYSIGITTNTDGTLKIDDAKLETALTTNYDSVKDLFTNDKTGLVTSIKKVSDTYAKTTSASTGILTKKAGYNGTIHETQNTLSKQIEQNEKRLTSLNALYSSEKTRYWNKFSALESLIYNSNSISSYLSSF